MKKINSLSFGIWAIFLLGCFSSYSFWMHYGEVESQAPLLSLEVTLPAYSDPSPPQLWVYYVKNEKDAPVIKEMKYGVRQTYQVQIPRFLLEDLKVLIRTPSRTEITIHSLALKRRNEIVKYEPKDLIQWIPKEIAWSLQKDGLHLNTNLHSIYLIKTFTLEPTNVSFFKIKVQWLSRIIKKSVNWAYDESSLKLLYIVLAFILGFFFFSLFDSLGRIHFFIGLTTVFGIIQGQKLLENLPGHPLVSMQSVGWSVYENYPKSREMLLLPLLLFLSVLISLSTFYILKKYKKNKKQEENFSLKMIQISLAHKVILVFCALYLSLNAGIVWYWDIASELENFRHPLFTSGWDNGNALLWQYLKQMGGLPYRDFFYPYGAISGPILGFPFNFIFFALYQGTLLSITLLSFHLFFNMRWTKTLTTFGIWLVLHTFGLFPVVRYAEIIPVIISYLNIQQEKQAFQKRHVLFWLAFFYVLPNDPSQVMYALFALVGILGLECFKDWRFFYRTLKPRMIYDFLVPGLTLSSYALVLFYTGQLGGLIAFLRDMGGVSVSSATSSNIGHWIQFRGVDMGLFLWAGPLLTGLGLFEVMSSSGERKKQGMAVCVIGLVSCSMFFKVLIHADSAVGWMGVPLAGYLVYLAGDVWNSRIQKYWISFGLGACLAFVIYTKRLQPDWILVKTWPTVLSQSISVLFASAKERQSYIDSRWDSQRFINLKEERRLFDAIRSDLQPGGHDLFSLSDDQMLYILTKQRPPYFASFYDGGTLRAQMRTIQWLKEMRPKLVVFDPQRMEFGIPHIVRAPLVFEEVIAHYQFHQKIGNYIVLKRSAEPKNIDLEFWSQAFPLIDLGQLPNYTNIDKFSNCNSISNSSCTQFLTFKPKKLDGPYQNVKIEIKAGGKKFEVKYVHAAGTNNTVVALDRLWFWGELRKMGLHPNLGKIEPEGDVQLVMRASRDDILY